MSDNPLWLSQMRGIPNNRFVRNFRLGYTYVPTFERMLGDSLLEDQSTLLSNAVDNYLYRIVFFLRMWLARTRKRIIQLEEFRRPSVLASIRSRELVGTKRKRS